MSEHDSKMRILKGLQELLTKEYMAKALRNYTVRALKRRKDTTDQNEEVKSGNDGLIEAT
jgi:hypothetical protein